MPLLSTHLSICIAEDETNGGEEIAFSGAIVPNYHVVFRGERLDDGLFLVAVPVISFKLSISPHSLLTF